MLKGAQVDLARYQGLAAQNAVPHQTLDTQVALVAQDQGTVEADRATVKSAEVNLQYCRILSPLDGRVGLRQVDQGNYVTPGDANGLVVITQLQPISVLFTVPEDNLQAISKRIQAGAVLPAAAYDRSGATKIADGTLQTFDSQIDPTTGTIKLRAQFSERNARRSIPTSSSTSGCCSIPTRTSRRCRRRASSAACPAPSSISSTPTAPSRSARSSSASPTATGSRFVSGIAPGDRIVIDGADKLRDGAKINVRAEAGAGNAGGACGRTPDKSGGKKRRSDGGQKQ